MIGKLAIYSKNGLLPGLGHVSVAEICEHTGRSAINIANYAKEGHFGTAKSRGGVSVYSVELVNRCILNGMPKHAKAEAKAGSIKLVTK